MKFDPQWGGPAKPVPFDELVSWADPDGAGGKILLRAGRVPHDVRPARGLSSKSWASALVARFGRRQKRGQRRAQRQPELGVAWTEPFRVELTGHLRDGATNWRSRSPTSGRTG